MSDQKQSAPKYQLDDKGLPLVQPARAQAKKADPRYARPRSHVVPTPK